MAGERTLLAKMALVRYIREGSLKIGDRLPTQNELRQQLGFGSATITAALRELHSEGVIEIRDKIGVFVLNPRTDGHTGRVIGIVINATEVSAFRCSLAIQLQICFSRWGWQLVPFFCEEQVLNGKLSLSSVSGLRRVIEQGGIEALITLGDFSQKSLDYFAAKKLPVLFVGCLEVRCPRIVIDVLAFLHAAQERLSASGIRRLAILIPEALSESLHEEIRKPEFRENTPLILTGNFVQDGVAAARELLQYPPTDRPEAVIIFDDTLASSFTVELFRQRESCYLPKMAILSNLQNPMDFAAEEPLIFSVNLAELASLTAAALEKLLGNDDVEAVYYMPQYIERKVLS